MALCDADNILLVWSEFNLANFIQSTFPAELTPILLNAIPVLHQFLLRLGSFLCQNDPDRHLTLDVLKMAIALLLEHDSEQWMLHGEDQASFRVVTFQSMAGTDNGLRAATGAHGPWDNT